MEGQDPIEVLRTDRANETLGEALPTALVMACGDPDSFGSEDLIESRQ
jgi:hypothetical protein